MGKQAIFLISLGADQHAGMAKTVSMLKKVAQPLLPRPVGLVEYQHILPDGTPTNFYQELFWDFKKYPHALLVGGTGSGKTTLLKNMLAQFIYRDKEAEIYLATYKPRCEDFSNIMESPHFGDYSHCQEVFHRFYERFLDRLLCFSVK